MNIFKDTRGKCWYDIIPEFDGEINVSVNYPGTIRAFHYHEKRTEWLFAIQGEFKVILKNKIKKIIFISQGEVVKVDPHVWVGYQVLGNKTGIMLQINDRKYNSKNPDNIKKIYNAFDDWEIEKK